VLLSLGCGIVYSSPNMSMSSRCAQGCELPGLQSLEVRRNEAFGRVQRVTSDCYPSDRALPLDHIQLRLEQISAGIWPHRDSEPLTDFRGVADNMVKVILFINVPLFIYAFLLRGKLPALHEFCCKCKSHGWAQKMHQRTAMTC